MIKENKYIEFEVSECIQVVDSAEADRIQDMLRHRCLVERIINTDEIRLVAGADAAYDQEMVYAALVVMTFPGLDVVEKTCSVQTIPFPYIPGLLSFREGPAIIDAFRNLTTVPDLILINGHGIAHPKRIGLASHIGVVLDIPSIGVAQHLLTGKTGMPDSARGSIELVLDNNEIIGMAVRTRQGAKPVYVSAGHKVDLSQAVDISLITTLTHRLTEPIWYADQVARKCRNNQSKRKYRKRSGIFTARQLK